VGWFLAAIGVVIVITLVLLPVLDWWYTRR
jgi:hypothetical protein